MDVIQEYIIEVTNKTLGIISSDGETIQSGTVLIDFHDILKQITAEGVILPPQGIHVDVVLKTTDIKNNILGIPVTVKFKVSEINVDAYPKAVLFKTKKGDILYGIKSNEGGMTTYKEDDRPKSKSASKGKTKSRPSVGRGTRDFFDSSGHPNSKVVKQKI